MEYNITHIMVFLLGFIVGVSIGYACKKETDDETEIKNPFYEPHKRKTQKCVRCDNIINNNGIDYLCSRCIDRSFGY